MKEIILNNGDITVVDDIDYLEFMPYTWYLNVGKYVWREIYINKISSTIWLHREILKRVGIKEFEMCDHIDGNTLNNLRSNLRPATRSQNGMNGKLSSNNTSGYRNIHWSVRDQIWKASIQINGQRIHIGSYKRKEQAIFDYKLMAKLYYGEFARFDDEGENHDN